MCVYVYVCIHIYIYIYIYIYICKWEILANLDKMIEIGTKVDKSSTYNGFSSNISFFIPFFIIKHFLIFFYILAFEEVDKIKKINV